MIAALLGVVIGVCVAMVFSRVTDAGRKFNGDYSHWNKLNLILQQIEQNYVDTIDIRTMTDAAVVAALHELDPHSVYLPPVELKESETELAGNFEGIGIQFNVPNDTAIVLSVIPGGPSEKAGLLQGDRILRVDDHAIAGMKTPQDSMVTLMKGPAGSKVRITVLRDGAEIPFDIERDRIPLNSVDAAFMVNDTTGYIRLSKFSRTTYTEFTKAAEKLLSEGMTRLVFDLRDNTGGYLDQALLLSNEFLRKGDMIVYMDGLHRQREEFKADGRGSLQDIGLSVLINESSASYTPSGRCIQKPYTSDYEYDIFERYAHGEMTDADSMRVDTSVVYHTVSGRKVYGGGGIVPDIFVPVDTTRVTDFYVQCNRKAEQMRFASAMFDTYRDRLSSISDFSELETWLSELRLDRKFLDYAAKDGIVPRPGEWEKTEPYIMPQLNALVGRYSRLEDEAFYRFYLEIDETIRTALEVNAGL